MDFLSLLYAMTESTLITHIFNILSKNTTQWNIFNDTEIQNKETRDHTHNFYKRALCVYFVK